MVSYYQKHKHNPEFRKKLAERSRIYRQRRMLDPNYREKMRAYGRERYHKRIKTDPEQLKSTRARIAGYVRKRREHQQEIRRELQTILGSKCSDCGLTDWRLLDFDHIDPMTKTMNVSQNLHIPFAVLKHEISKCELRCPNCHRLKTIEKKQHDPRIRVFRNPSKNGSF